MGLKDSKQLTQQQREQLDGEVRSAALAVAVAEVDAATIDRINIYQASRLAMLLAVQQLTTAPDHLLIDAMLLDHRLSPKPASTMATHSRSPSPPPPSSPRSTATP